MTNPEALIPLALLVAWCVLARYPLLLVYMCAYIAFGGVA